MPIPVALVKSLQYTKGNRERATTKEHCSRGEPSQAEQHIAHWQMLSFELSCSWQVTTIKGNRTPESYIGAIKRHWHIMTVAGADGPNRAIIEACLCHYLAFLSSNLSDLG